MVRPEQGDRATFSISRSFISWPTPFDFNFMSGHSPSSKRHMYYRLLWHKPDGTELDMLWRYDTDSITFSIPMPVRQSERYDLVSGSMIRPEVRAVECERASPAPEHFETVPR